MHAGDPLEYFDKDDAPVMFDPETFRVCMLLGDRWIEVGDEALRETIRFHSREISQDEALALASRRLCSLHAGGSGRCGSSEGGAEPMAS